MRDILSQSLEELHRQNNLIIKSELESNQQFISGQITSSTSFIDLSIDEVNFLLEILQSARPIFKTRIERIFLWLEYQFSNDKDRYRDFLIGFIESIALHHNREYISHYLEIVGNNEITQYVLNRLISGNICPTQRLKSLVNLILKYKMSNIKVFDIMHGMISGLFICYTTKQVHTLVELLFKNFPKLQHIAMDIIKEIT